MRQFVLVVGLVAASFLGGAFVNGPGLRWVQTQLLGSLGSSDGDEIASVDLKGAASPDAPAGEGSRPAPSGAEAGRGPLAPVPSLVSEAPRDQTDGADRWAPRPGGSGGARDRASQPPSPAAGPSPPPAPPPLMAPLASARAAAGPDPGEPPPIATSPHSSTPAAWDPSVAPAAATAAPASPDQGVRPAILDSLASLMSSAAPAPPDSSSSPPPPSAAPRRESPPRSEPQPQPEPARGADWSALGRRMQALGVSRFTLEGQPGGRVVFSCLIPLAGRQAVAQRFEAEGEDGFQAARAALQRVALWRATQN